MLINPIDLDNNLFEVIELMPSHIVQKVLDMPWLELKWIKQEGQELWPRRRILDSELSWLAEWDQHLESCRNEIATKIGTPINQSPNTATTFWLDEPGFTCPIHTDGEMEGSLHISWIGKENLGTTFYNFKDPNTVRRQFNFCTNNGYILLKNADNTGYRNLQWHGMLNPVPENTYRLTSYTWLYPSK